MLNLNTKSISAVSTFSMVMHNVNLQSYKTNMVTRWVFHFLLLVFFFFFLFSFPFYERRFGFECSQFGFHKVAPDLASIELVLCFTILVQFSRPHPKAKWNILAAETLFLRVRSRSTSVKPHGNKPRPEYFQTNLLSKKKKSDQFGRPKHHTVPKLVPIPNPY